MGFCDRGWSRRPFTEQAARFYRWGLDHGITPSALDREDAALILTVLRMTHDGRE